MTVELALTLGLVIVAVLSGALGFSGARTRTATAAKAVFYLVLAATLVALLVGVLGVGQLI